MKGWGYLQRKQCSKVHKGGAKEEEEEEEEDHITMTAPLVLVYNNNGHMGPLKRSYSGPLAFREWKGGWV